MKKNLIGLMLALVLLITGFVLTSCETFDDFAYGYGIGRGWFSYNSSADTNEYTANNQIEKY
ncbi:MAG: hypothetical protein FWB77_00700 [Treponema sp.]|nr:hypothetical protein [Treponema sp.]